MSEEPVLKDILEKYSPKRNNARKKAVAETIKATKADPKTASVRHTGLFHLVSGKGLTQAPCKAGRKFESMLYELSLFVVAS